MSPSTDTYAQRASTHPTPLGRKLLTIMSRKKTNLCVSLDTPSPVEILSLLADIGPYICLAKTHIDAIPFTAFSSFEDVHQFTASLEALAKEHDFLLFEDRKFADIGNTVKAQYGSGIYKIADWSHITNAHSVPGDGIIAGLREVAEGVEGGLENRGLLLLAEMSSKGTLAKGAYRDTTVEMARGEKAKGWVMGFIAQGAVETREGEDWIVMTPGVNLGVKGDALGQQYNTPEKVVLGGSDIIIVGRGIVAAADPVKEAVRYRDAGWKAYQKRAGREVDE
ncbi:orotidine-5'-phosphate decarboxylase [Ascodesmis nigricans]|uniref:Orotidine 5'-phosphate decarboxylase n=1 Tax=Ascodesmis nigricans TaxID=341454 RepID=A0A4S2N8J5_9PEZI|nr:orotidine-5'-phosphate decarboxylase [Ascodesmis nigricans]